jgi:hypothetical protein
MTTSRNTSRIPLTGVRLEAVGGCDGYLLGDLQIGTEKLHVEAVRVATDNHDQQPWHSTEAGAAELKETSIHDERANYHCNCYSRFKKLAELAGNGQFTSQRLQGHDGEWVLYATPYMQ